MEIYALFAHVAYERNDLLGLYASRTEAVAAATEFLRTEDGEDFHDHPSTGYGLYVETRILGESPEPQDLRREEITWLAVYTTADGASFAALDEFVDGIDE